MAKNKTPTRRNSVKYPALEKSKNLKNRQELMDQDYINKLSPKDKDWLNRFNAEYINADFTHDGPRVHPIKYKPQVVKATGEIRQVDVYKQKCEKMNNDRNVDTFTATKSNNMLKGEKEMKPSIEGNRTTDNNEIENALIEYIDSKNAKKS